METEVSQNSSKKGISFEELKDRFAVWAAITIFGFGNWQLRTISKSVESLSSSMAIMVTTSQNHEKKLDEHGIVLKELGNKDVAHEVDIAKLTVKCCPNGC